MRLLKQFCLVILVSLLLGACGLRRDSVSLTSLNRQDLEKDQSVTLVGSMLTPDDALYDKLVLWNMESGKEFYVAEETGIPVNDERYELSVFAIRVPPGSYVYSSSQTTVNIPYGNIIATTAWRGGEYISEEAFEAGDFRYIGRAVCKPVRTGCAWHLVNESAQDMTLLRAINPALPWRRLKSIY